MMFLKQSTAATVVLGPALDSTDAVTAEDGLTINQADIRLSKNGGAFAQTNNNAGATHMEAGYYSVPLDTTDTNTLGRLKVAVSESGALPFWADFMVLPANVYDSLVGGSDKLQVDTQEWAGSATDSSDVALATAPSNFAALAITAGGAVTVGTNNDKTGYTASTVSDKTGYSLSSAGIQAIWDALTSALTTVGSVGKRIADYLDAAVSGATAPSAATVAGAVWDEAISGHLTAGTTGAKLNTASGAAGSGNIEYTYTVTSSVGGAPLADVDVEVYTEAAMTNLIAVARTDAFGEAVFNLNAGTYYLKRVKEGYSFTNPDEEVVS